ncbi:hypothetical protein EH31_05845 [Erythrobacter longus]|uniref:Uncharacterized protein n=2 Tax=Erythrobacter longus TaxID=1044 RepID=A0A074MK08_ERYLO|nr:hypothetical protein EH31_05845 [Erythrobacter longus]
MFAFRKSKLDSFPCDSRDVCRIEEGSTNPYLGEPRLLEAFLSTFEPKYNRSCEAISVGSFGHDDVAVIAAFMAFVGGCAPTATRLGASNLSEITKLELDRPEKLDKLPPIPQELEATSVLELINDGKLTFDIDRKYPHALGVANLIESTIAFSSYPWEILRNGHSTQCPFLTSDFPIAIEGPQPPLTRLVPLRPDLAIKVSPVVRSPTLKDNPRDFRFRLVDVTPAQVRIFNRQVVRCAEDFVFSPISSHGIARLVKKYASHRLGLVSRKTHKERGAMICRSIDIVSD